MLTERQQKLIYFLEETDSFQKIADLSKKLGCSQRTTYSDISDLKQKGLAIITKRGVGIKYIKNDVVLLSKEPAPLSNTTERRVDILKRLLIQNETISLGKLSETYLVSQTSIKLDLEAIEILLDDGHGVFLKKDKTGTRLDCIPLERKLNLLTKVNQFISSVFMTSNHQNEGNANDVLSRFYPEHIVKVSNNVVYNFFRKNIFAIPEAYIDNFSHFFLAMISQLHDGHHILNKGHALDQARHAFFIGNATDLLHKVSLRLKISYTNEDVQYLSQMLVNYRIEQSVPLENKGESQLIIDKISEVMDHDFSTDEVLKQQLDNHIPAMISRLEYGTVIKNPFLEQIKLDFSILFNSIWIAMQSLSKFLGVTFNEDEIAFLTLYFQLSIEKSGSVRRILVICPSGIVTSELLINRINKLAPSLDEVEVASVEEFLELDESKYDLILTTTFLDKQSKNIHYISAFTKNEELSKILHQDSTSELADVSTKSKYPEIPNYIMLNKNFHNRSSLFDNIGQYLREQNLITEGFMESIKERERLGSTELPFGVAIPHGKPEYVRESFVVFVQNKRKIKWSSHFVDIIFIVGIAKKDMKKTKEVISRIYNLISNEHQLVCLKNEENEMEVMKYLYGK